MQEMKTQVTPTLTCSCTCGACNCGCGIISFTLEWSGSAGANTTGTVVGARY